MRSRIVTSTYRYKRPPRKRKAVPSGAGDREAEGGGEPARFRT
jgi:hypothetical protein